MSSSRPRGWAFGCLLIALGSLWFAERVSGGKEVSVPVLLGVVGVAALVSSVWVPDAGDPPQPARNEFLSQLGGTAVTAGIVLLVILAFGSLSVGTLQEKPTSIKASSTSFRRGVGAVRLDLSTLTTASTKEFTASVGVGTYFALAFVVGYQEDVFRRLVRRVTEVILAPGGVTPSTPARVVLQRSPDGSIAAEQPYSLVAIVLDGANRPIDESVPVVFELTRAADDGGAAQKATFVQDTQGGRATQVVPGAGSSVGRAPGRFEAKAAAGTVASDPVTLEWI